jgi:hypothetical protein
VYFHKLKVLLNKSARLRVFIPEANRRVFMKKNLTVAISVAIAVFSTSAYAEGTPSADGAYVYFANLEDGAKVASPVKVIFALSGMGVAPAGTEKVNTGHHHLLIDRAPFGEGEDGADELIYGIPSDDNHRHFGGGQTEVVLDLTPGTHSLQMVLGDMGHVPHNKPVMSEVITITVE